MGYLNIVESVEGGFFATAFFKIISTANSGRAIHEIIEDDYLYPAFGKEHILERYTIVNNNVLQGMSNGFIVPIVKSMIPNEVMIFGTLCETSMSSNNRVAINGIINNTQLALMSIAPFFINPSAYWYYLCDVVDYRSFSAVSGSSHPSNATPNNGSEKPNVRPIFGLIG